ncbi:MAG: glucokinase [Anaerolineales bacterium]
MISIKGSGGGHRLEEKTMLLAGDIGGTKTILAIYAPESEPRNPVAEARFLSGDYPSLEAVIRDFLGQTHLNVKRAAFGVAGPVVGGEAEITNLPWAIAENQLRDALELESIHLINDLAAVACAVPVLQPDEVHVLQEGRAVPGGSIAVIAPGTGLGEAYLTWDGKRYLAHASEGGHTDFAPTTPLQFGLLRYLQERFGHVSYERICSGRGLPNIYNYLKEMGFASEPAWVAGQFAQTGDPTPVIVRAALSREKPCDLCRAALETFVSILGAEAGNLALKVLATGGVYLGGGIPSRILPALSDGSFIKPFRQKGRFADLLAEIPVKVILNPKVALLGAARHVLNQ